MTSAATSAEASGRFITAGKARVHLHELGEGSPVVLLHGAGPGATGWTNFEPNIGALSERHRVIVPDMPGWGQSDSARVAGDPVDTLLHLLDELGIERAALVGNSMGGMTSLRFAVEYPDRVSHVVTMGAPCPGNNMFTPGGGLTEGLKVLRAGYENPSPENIKRMVQIMCFDPALATDELAKRRSAAAHEHPQHLEHYLEDQIVPGAREFHALGARISEIAAPVLAIHGRDDRVMPFEASLRLVAGVPDSRLLLLNRCGHWAQIEHSAEFNRVVAQFIENS
ncbi:alpha/beta hydrolase [Streptomyces sp. NPDC091215]|uniref:alpha/beta fold hydrolase n=1 Tax=Streptomyces sp. NPDC091215 TaxID=3155192 RepID=UPI003445C20A